MTRVQPHTPYNPGRLDDGVMLQRRLLQDLERQWLAAWTVVHQQPACPAAAPPPASEADPPPGPATVESFVSSPSAAPAGHGLAQQRVAPTSPQAATSNAVAPRGSVQRTLPAAPAQARPNEQSTDAGDLGTPVGRPRQADGNTGHIHPVSAQATPASRAQPPLAEKPSEAIDADPRGTSQRPFPIGQSATDLAQASQAAGASLPTVERPLHSPPPSSITPVRASAGDLAGRTPTVAAAVAATAPSRAGPMAAFRFPTSPRTEPLNPEQEAQPARRFATPTRAEDAAAGPRRLTLRETDPQSVLATLRDVELGAQQSQLAADGLARALMEAGYARVHVVVNGRQPGTEQDATGAALFASSPPNEASSRTNQAPKERRHGR